MKLHLSVLQKLIELPTPDPVELRHLLDDLGLEVKDIDRSNGEVIFNIETLANRGDHLSAIGVAREISARLLAQVKHPQLASSLGDRKSSFAVRKSTEKCLRYALLELQLPERMPLRPEISSVLGSPDPARHAIVHLLNYIWLELGQPMHAFDREKVEGEVVIEELAADAEIQALDGVTYRVPAGSIVIKDRRKIIAVAGVIGCANTMVSAETRHVLIESATFDPVTVRKTARAMGLSTDASYTFERGADVDAVVPALKRVAYLAATGGDDSARLLGFTLIEGKATERRKIRVRMLRVRTQLNSPRLNEAEVLARLKLLGFGLEAGAPEGEVSLLVPSWRLWDLCWEEDVIEEIVRSHGFNRIRAELPPLDPEIQPLEPLEELQRMIEAPLVGAGFYEVISKSFYSAEDAAHLGVLDPVRAAGHITMKNSLERGYSHLKVTNLLHLARLAEHNLRKGCRSIKVFEFGRLFSKNFGDGSAYEFERDTLSLAVAGRWGESEWRQPESLDELLSHLKGVLQGIFDALAVRCSVVPAEDPLLHPGCQASLKVGRERCGVFGLIHPQLREVIDVRAPVLYAELSLDSLLKIREPRVITIPSDLPAIRRDLTLRVPPRVFASKVSRLIEDEKLEDLRAVSIVDDFKRDEESFRRVTYRITFQSDQRTLEHSEVDQKVSALLSALGQAGFELAA